MYDPRELASKIERQVCDGILRKYYRLIRKDRWYGGICTSDCVGCNLRCIFCWSQKPRETPEKIGTFYSPQQIFEALAGCARKYKITQLRVSGNEPTIGKEHLLSLLRLVDSTQYTFILETNGTLIDEVYAEELSQFKNLHVRVSIKGASPEEFSRLTGAHPDFFQLQLSALTNLLEAGVNFNPAVMLSFSAQDKIKKFKDGLEKISPSLLHDFEDEYIFLYPHVVKRLQKARIKPIISYSPQGIPKELI